MRESPRNGDCSSEDGRGGLPEVCQCVLHRLINDIVDVPVIQSRPTIESPRISAMPTQIIHPRDLLYQLLKEPGAHPLYLAILVGDSMPQPTTALSIESALTLGPMMIRIQRTLRTSLEPIGCLRRLQAQTRVYFLNTGIKYEIRLCSVLTS